MKAVLLLPALLLTAACGDFKTQYETAPVALSTDQGQIVCQLYKPETVMWDRATSRPASLTDDQANRLCRAEGEIRKGRSPAEKIGVEAAL